MPRQSGLAILTQLPRSLDILACLLFTSVFAAVYRDILFMDRLRIINLDLPIPGPRPDWSTFTSAWLPQNLRVYYGLATWWNLIFNIFTLLTLNRLFSMLKNYEAINVVRYVPLTLLALFMIGLLSDARKTYMLAYAREHVVMY
jgi:hypothetical protein